MANGKFKNWWQDHISTPIGSWWRAKTGMELSAAEQSANAFNASEAQKTRDFSEYMYNEYESPKAMMDQYRDAGVNPALMFGGNMPSPTVPTGSANSVSPDSETAIFGDMLNMVSGIIGLKQQIDLNQSQIATQASQQNMFNAQADLYEKEAEGQRLDNRWKDALYGVEFNVGWETVEKLAKEREKADAEIVKILAEARKIDVDTALSRKQIEIGDKTIELIGSQIENYQALTTLNKLNASTVQAILPYVADYQESLIRLNDTQRAKLTVEQDKIAQDTQLALVQVMKEQGLIDSGYYDELVADIKAGRISKYVDMMCNIVGTVANTTGMIMDHTGSGRITTVQSKGRGVSLKL